MATSDTTISPENNRQIDSAVMFFENNRERFDSLARSLRTCLLEDDELSDMIHFIRQPSDACRDQLKVLARLTSGCGRLVDSIFKTHGEATAAQP